jgi:ADP-heptose:LPS heptosyltransferase
MNKAFFINGGAGRVLCSIPALEEYAKSNEDFIVVAEAWGEFYSCSKVLRDKVYSINHKNLFEFLLKDKEIISPEPYRLNAYFNQKCNLIQAFDIIINNLDHVPETKKINIDLNKQEQINGHNTANEVREVLKKDKVIVFQPFGSSAKMEGKFIYDSTGRSFELSNIYKIIEELKKNYGVILMTQIPIPDWDKLGVACPQNVSITQWAGIINASDYFLGCDSMGQHIAYGLNKPATIVIGSTYPENISYPNNKNFYVIDNGKGRKKYSPIRISFEDSYDRHNEDLMIMNDERIKEIVKSIKDKIGVSKVNNETLNLSDATKQNQNALQISPAMMPGFSKPKNNGKKTIDKILELNDIKN